MNQKIFNNVLLLLIILLIIRYISPEQDSVLFILKKYLNFLIYRMRRVLNRITNNQTEDFISEFTNNTFEGIKKMNFKAPTFTSAYENYWIEYIISKNPKINLLDAKKLYRFIESLVSTDTDDYFISSSNIKPNEFTNEQLIKLQNVILQKLNSSIFEFKNFKYNKKPLYFNNVGGKEIEPFTFNVDCSHQFQKLEIFIEINIRNDVVQNYEYLTIKKIRIVLDNFKQPKQIHKEHTINLDDNINKINSCVSLNKNLPKYNEESPWINNESILEEKQNSFSNENILEEKQNLFSNESEFDNIIEQTLNNNFSLENNVEGFNY
jgi:hypothetical protein